MIRELRQSGITTLQMLNAPKDAVYVWVNSKLLYPKHLARHLGRDDLVICTRGLLTAENVVLSKTYWVIDHALEEQRFTSSQIDALVEISRRNKTRRL